MDILRTAQRRIAAALRFGMPLRHWTAGRHALCERAPMVSSVTSHCGVTHYTLTVTSTGEREQDHTGRSCVRCKGSSNRRGDMRTRSATSLSSTTGPYRRAEQSLSCAVPPFDTVAWFPGVLQQQWIDVSVRCPNAQLYHANAVNAGEAETVQKLWRSCKARWSMKRMERFVHAGIKLLQDLVATAAANGNCSPHAVVRWRTQQERVLLSAKADTFLRALGSRAAATGQQAAPSPPAQEDQRAVFVIVLEEHSATHMRKLVRQRQRQVDRLTG